MPLFVYVGRDGARGAELRKLHRPEHLDHIAALEAEGRVRYAGPLIDTAGAPCGSLVVFEAPDRSAAHAVASGDPYVLRKIFAGFDLYETKQVFPKPGAEG